MRDSRRQVDKKFSESGEFDSGPVIGWAAIVVACGVFAAGACTSGTDEDEWPLARESADAEVLFRSRGTGTEGVVLRDDPDVDVTEGRIQRPSPEQWKPVSGLGEIRGLELVDIHVGVVGAVDSPSPPRSRAGLVRGMAREGGRRIELRDPEFRKCRTAEALEFEVAPGASDECYYIDGEVVNGRVDTEYRDSTGSVQRNLTVSFGADDSGRAEYRCTVVFGDEPRAVLAKPQWFRVGIDSFPRAVLRGQGSVEPTCTANNEEATSSELRVENLTGWTSGSDSPGLRLVNIALRLRVAESTGETSDDEASRTLTFWTNLDPERVPFLLDD